MVICKKNQGATELAYPNIFIRADFPVAIIQNNIKVHESKKLANDFVKFLYSPPMQNLLVKHFIRPTDPEILKATASQFPSQGMICVEEFGDWSASRKYFFEIGGLCEQVMNKAENYPSF